MTYLSRNLIRRMIIAEARKRAKAPLLDLSFDDTENLTDLDMSNIEGTEVVDINKDTKIASMPTDLSPLYDDDDDDISYEDKTELGFGVTGIDDFMDSEEESESETVENPLPKAAYDEKFRLQPDMVSQHDPAGRTHSEIKQDVFDSYDDLYKPATKKSEAQKEAEFLKKMEDMINQGRPAAEFPDDPEFGTSDTLELPRDRFRIDREDKDEDTEDLDETISRLVRESMRRRLKKSSKLNRF